MSLPPLSLQELVARDLKSAAINLERGMRKPNVDPVELANLENALKLRRQIVNLVSDRDNLFRDIVLILADADIQFEEAPEEGNQAVHYILQEYMKLKEKYYGHQQ